MSKIKNSVHLLPKLSWLLAIAPTLSKAQTQRPPQYVLMAFDGCVNNTVWNEVHDFLDKMNRENSSRLRFTFFVSATALLSDNKAHLYVNPSKILREPWEIARDPQRSAFPEKAARLQAGKTFSTQGESNIGWGGRLEDVRTRVKWINEAYRKGNEIASHAVGHFKGGQWSVDMWNHEIEAFEDIFANVGTFNGDPSIQLAPKSRDIVGMRAPYLQGGANLIRALDKNKFRYDTSDGNLGWESNNWPQKYKVQGSDVWNFALAFIDVVGLKNAQGQQVRTLSMDYNFCALQDAGCREKYPASAQNADRDARTMLISYLKYFVDNYNGNRAPVHIGHHFTPYRSGAYNKALFQFAKIVCQLPEVKCATYSQLADFMDRLDDETRKNFQAARFPKADKRPTLEDLIKEIRF